MRAAKGALGLLTAALVLLSLGPLVLPFQVFPVLGSSMAPAIPAGSALLVTRVPASQLRVGDVVTFQPPGSDAFVTSRVYALGLDLETKADAHSTPDPWRLSRQGSGSRGRSHTCPDDRRSSEERQVLERQNQDGGQDEQVSQAAGALELGPNDRDARDCARVFPDPSFD